MDSDEQRVDELETAPRAQESLGYMDMSEVSSIS